MYGFFDVNSIFVVIPWLEYPMSYVEFIGTVLGFWCVIETTRVRLITWPLGILNTILFTMMFYQLNLYSDMLLNAYFFGTQIYGWWKWSRQKKLSHNCYNCGGGIPVRI